MKFIQVAILLCVWFCALAAGEKDVVVVDGNTTDSGDKDFDRSDIYDPSYCIIENKECPGDDEVKEFAVSARACATTCNRNLKCASVFFINNHCHHRSNRCTSSQLVDRPGATQLYRRKKGEACTEETGPDYNVVSNYSRTFCRLKGFRCPTKGLESGQSLYKNPQSLRPWLTCLTKCAKIRSCIGVDFYTEEKKACDLRKQMCSEEELVEDKDAENYVRLEEGVTTCDEDRDEVKVPGC